MNALLGPEADPPLLAGHADLDVRDLLRRHAEATPSAIGEPHDGVLGERRLHLLHEGGGVGVVGHVDFDLAGRLGDSDADLHWLSLLTPARVRARDRELAL